MLRLLHWCNILLVICLAIKLSVLIIGYSLIKSISFSPFVPTKGAKALHLVQLFVVAVAAVTAAGSNSKKETGTDKITANSRSSSGKGQMLFERCSSCCCYCVKSEFFCPRWLNEKLFA